MTQTSGRTPRSQYSRYVHRRRVRSESGIMRLIHYPVSIHGMWRDTPSAEHAAVSSVVYNGETAANCQTATCSSVKVDFSYRCEWNPFHIRRISVSESPENLVVSASATVNATTHSNTIAAAETAQTSLRSYAA